MPTPRTRAALVLAAAALTATAGIGATLALGDDQGPFQPGTGTGSQTMNCLPHQPHTPSDSATASSSRTLMLLRYYTLNGKRPYCDGKPPTKADAQWLRLYLELGGNPALVHIPRISG